MTALNKQWQAARHLRQSEVVDRRNQVSADLESWQSDRLVEAVQLRQNLAQIAADLRTETDHWLTQTAQQRQAQIPSLRQALQRYTEQLQTETQAWLADYQADRELSAIAVRQQLAQDNQARRAAVSELRLDIAQDLQAIQQQVAAIQQQTAVDQAGYRQEQAMVRAELLPELADYVATLQLEVQSALGAMSEVRQEAEAVQREQRQRDRQTLTATVDAMFHQLADFRQGLKVQRAELTHQVWGTESAHISPPATPGTRAPQSAKVAPQVTARPPVVRARLVPAVPPPAAKPAPSPKSAPASKPAPAVQSASVVQPAAPSPVVPVPAPLVEVAGESVTPMAVAVADPVVPPSPSLEEVVYNYLHLAQGAHLSDIETELGINRFQAVDALRVLIQKDLIVKQDRNYLVKEEAVL